MSKYIFEANINQANCSGCPFHISMPNNNWDKCMLCAKGWYDRRRPFDCPLEKVEDTVVNKKWPIIINGHIIGYVDPVNETVGGGYSGNERAKETKG